MKQQRYGSARQHGLAHEREHGRKSGRRGFLKKLGTAGAGAFVLGNTPVKAFSATPLNYLTTGVSDRVLVVLRLAGGNDGLNTFVPLYDYDTYASLRPNIRHTENNLLSLSNNFAMPTFMDDLMPMWAEGQMKVVNSVGYPMQNLSHFRSMDIWESGSDADEQLVSGWLGRLITEQHPDLLTNPPAYPPAVQIGAPDSILFNDYNFSKTSFSVTQAEELEEVAASGELYDPLDVPDCYHGDQLSYLRSVTNSTFVYSDVLSQAYQGSSNSLNYQYDLGRQLALVARLIKGGMQTRLYMVSIGGFDTHANQPLAHQNLLRQISTQIPKFFADLGSGPNGRARDVLCMSMSEFGRRIEENASTGTDHGSGAPVMLFGKGLNGNGFLGENPDLQNTDNSGNLVNHTDFRELYASVLENWLCLDPNLIDDVLGQSFSRFDLGLNCQAVSTTTPPRLLINTQIRYAADGSIFFDYRIPGSGEVTLEVFDLAGRQLERKRLGRQAAGEHSEAMRPGRWGVGGMFVLRLTWNGHSVSRRVRGIR